MAEKHIINFSMIHNFFKENSKQLEKGENAYVSKHVEKFTFDGSFSPPVIKGSVAASMKKKTYLVEMFLSLDKKEIINMTCNCPRGQAICHHMAALAFHAHYNVSVTDEACMWSVKKSDSENVQKFKDLFPAKKFTATTRRVTDDEKSRFKKELSVCHVVGFTWLLRPEAPAAFMSIVPAIEDILFSTEYLEATNKIEYFCNCCKVDYETIHQIAVETAGQYMNESWLVSRKHRLTASRFGAVLKAISREKFPPSLFKNLLGNYNLDKVMAVQWGRQHESTALQCFTEETGLDVQQTGLWLDMCGFLGASPDGLVGENSLVEVKCPHKFRDVPLDEALLDKSYIVYHEDGQPVINGDHVYYHQIQGQLHMSNRENCYLIIWTSKEHRIYNIERNLEWGENINLLKTFYLEKVIPYICSMKM